MVSPDALTQGLSNLFKGAGTTAKINYTLYFIWIFWGVIIALVFYAIYTIMTYRYKVIVHTGSVEYDNEGRAYLRVLKIKKDRAKPINDHGISKWRLLFSMKKIEPIDNKYIQPGNYVYLLRTGLDCFNPMPLRIGNPSVCYDIDPFDRSFFNLGVQQDARDYQNDNALKKAQVTFIVICGMLIIFAGFILWLAFKQAGTTTEKMGMIAQIFENAKGMAP